MRYILLLIIGLVIGAGAAIFFLGVPRAKATPGARVQAPAPGGDPPATVVVSVSDSFFEGLLGTVFRDLGPPTFNLSGAIESPGTTDFRPAAFQGGCTNSVTISSEGSNAKTQVQLAGGKISAPLVFSGQYNVLGQCTQFKGWAQTTIQLSFDQPNQTLYGRMNVEGVNLEGVNPLANSFVTVFVRTAIDSRLNPIQFLRPQQLQLMVPVQASNGAVKATVKDVRSEVQDGSLRLHITYDFGGAKGQQPQV
ncbi:MAG TPA: hypothetical protein VK208_22635 [Pyrinomonadaceae bacterium]|jgi:hypothetical protein|nr:hypothetical protein [Pyrinomonadaceae bacterium]